MKLVVGLVGRIASGKGTVAEYLSKEYSARTYRFSDILRDMLKEQGKEVTRENLQDLGVELRKEFGENILASKLKEKILSENYDGLVVVDGVRYWNEVEMVKSLGNSILLSVSAPVEVRYERALGRGTRGEKDLTLDDFKKNESKETEREIDEIILKADIQIENIGGVESLLEKVTQELEGKV